MQETAGQSLIVWIFLTALNWSRIDNEDKTAGQRHDHPEKNHEISARTLYDLRKR